MCPSNPATKWPRETPTAVSLSLDPVISLPAPIGPTRRTWRCFENRARGRPRHSFWRLHRREIVCFPRGETTTQTLVVTQLRHRGTRRPAPRPGNASARAELCAFIARLSLLAPNVSAASAGHSPCSGTGNSLFMDSGAGDHRGTALRRCVCKHGWLAHRRFPCRGRAACVAASPSTSAGFMARLVVSQQLRRWRRCH